MELAFVERNGYKRVGGPEARGEMRRGEIGERFWILNDGFWIHRHLLRYLEMSSDP